MLQKEGRREDNSANSMFLDERDRESYEKTDTCR